jgi:hypothetical protein
LKNPNVKITNEGDETKKPNLDAKPTKSAFKAGKNVNPNNDKNAIQDSPRTKYDIQTTGTEDNVDDFVEKYGRLIGAPDILINATKNKKLNSPEESDLTKSSGIKERTDIKNRAKLYKDELNKKWLSDEYTPEKWEEKHKEVKIKVKEKENYNRLK